MQTDYASEGLPFCFKGHFEPHLNQLEYGIQSRYLGEVLMLPQIILRSSFTLGLFAGDAVGIGVVFLRPRMHL